MARINYHNADPIEIRRAVIVALTDYVEQYGEISDDPDDLNSAAAAIWSALGASKHDKPANDGPIYSQNQPETAGCAPNEWKASVAHVIRDIFPRDVSATIIGSDAFGELVYRVREYCQGNDVGIATVFDRAVTANELTFCRTANTFCGTANEPAAFLTAKVRDLL